MARQAISENRPWFSNSIGCAPDIEQIKAHNEALKELGVKNAHIAEDGRAVAYSNKGRNELMKAYGKMDKDAGYGQHSGT